MSQVGILQAFIFNEQPFPSRFWSNCEEFLAEAVEPYFEDVGGAHTLHLPALTVAHLSVSIFKVERKQRT